MTHQFNRDAESRLKILQAIAPLNTFTHDEVLSLVALHERVDPHTLESLWLVQLIVDEPSLVTYDRDQREYTISKTGRELLQETTTDLTWKQVVDNWAVPYYQTLMEQFSMPEPNNTQKLIYARAEKNLAFHQNRLR